MTGRTINLPSAITSQIQGAAILTARIEAVTKHLAQLMDELHGDECKYDVSHEAGAEFIMLSPGMKRGRSSRSGPVDNGDSGERA